MSEAESKGLQSFTELEKSVRDYRATTIEMFKMELIKINKSETLEDEVWALKSDLLQNYNAYFPEHNPTNIENKYSQL